MAWADKFNPGAGLAVGNVLTCENPSDSEYCLAEFLTDSLKYSLKTMYTTKCDISKGADGTDKRTFCVQSFADMLVDFLFHCWATLDIETQNPFRYKKKWTAPHPYYGDEVKVSQIGGGAQDIYLSKFDLSLRRYTTITITVAEAQNMKPKVEAAILALGYKGWRWAHMSAEATPNISVSTSS